MWRKLYCDEKFWDTVEKIKNLHSFRINELGRIEVIENRRTQGTRFPWVMMEQRGGRCCGHWLGICWNHFRFIPEYCRNHCYKIVVRPKTVSELVNKVMPILGGVGFWGKCGIDTRPYTENLYLSALYAETSKDGFAVLNEVRGLLPGVDIHMKRMCTEMELEYPEPTVLPGWGELERRVSDIFHVTPDPIVRQASWIKNAIVFNWMRYAREKGDMTYKEIVGEIFPIARAKFYEAEKSRSEDRNEQSLQREVCDMPKGKDDSQENENGHGTLQEPCEAVQKDGR